MTLPTELIDALNKGIIQCIQTSGKILPSSFLKSDALFVCQWTEYAIEDESLQCSPVVEDLRQFISVLNEIPYDPTDAGNHHMIIGSDGRPLLYAACLGLLLAPRESHSDRESKSKATPLSTFLDISTFLDDELDVDMNEPTQTEGACHRPPLHLLARACYPEAVEFLTKRADVNLCDDEGWTALMACCLPDILSSEDGGPTDEERVKTIEILKIGNFHVEVDGDGADSNNLEVNAQNYCGYTALHYACEGLNLSLIECLLNDNSETKLDVTLRTVWGESAFGIVRSQRDLDAKKAAKCETYLKTHFERIEKSNPIHVFLADEKKAFDLMNLIEDVLIPASRNKDGRGGLVAQDRLIVRALMCHLSLDSSVLFDQKVFQQYDHEHMNIYEHIYHCILDLIPQPLIRVYCNRNPTNEEREVVTCMDSDLRESCIEIENGVRRVNTLSLMSQAFRLHRERGHVARQVELLTNLFVGPLQRTISFAIPSNTVLQQIVQMAPRILEVGAGTGYWSYQLSRLGADVIAYDSNPPGEESADESNTGDNIYFGSQSYYPVEYGIASTIFSGECSDIIDRALLFVWPNNPDAIDNPHVVVAPEILPEIWDISCLEKYYEMGGTTVIFVGERKENIELMHGATAPDWGFCASREFQEFLQAKYHLKARLECPKWWMKEDDVTIWKRR